MDYTAVKLAHSKGYNRIVRLLQKANPSIHSIEQEFDKTSGYASGEYNLLHRRTFSNTSSDSASSCSSTSTCISLGSFHHIVRF